jgi:GNAT superfamily N-acetyltransferase
MTVRQIKDNELEKLLVLYEHLHDDDANSDMDVLKKVWQNILSNQNFIYFVVEQDNLLISTCNVTIIPNLTRRGRSIGLIENVVTHREYRNRGLGKLVMETAIDFAKSNNCYKVMLLSSSKRLDAHKFYANLGFSSEDKIGYVKMLSR